MKVDIKTDETTTGMVFKKTYPRATLIVEFSEEEKAIINTNKLKDVVLIERDCPMDRDNGNYYPEDEPDFWNVTVGKLLMNPKGVDHVAKSNTQIKDFIEQAKEALPQLKGLIEGNATSAEDESFEL